MELSVFDSGDRDVGGSGGGKRGGAETLGIYLAGGAGTEVAAACCRRAGKCFSGGGRRWCNRCGTDPFADRQACVHGQRVYRQAHRAIAAERLLPVVLELGGKDPMLVLDGADVEVVSSAAVWGAFVNAGQTCLSVERCYVHRSLYEKFLKACAEKTKRLRVGNGRNPETDVGPMIHQRQLQIVEAHVNDAVACGARVLAGGSRLPELGANFYKPTVLADVTHEMRIMREETFGPVLPVMAFDSEDEAIRLVNDSEFGLAASVWTRDNDRGRTPGATHSGGYRHGERCSFMLRH